VYLRRQDLRIESYYHQRVAGGFLAQPFEDFLAESIESSDYFELARRWATAFGHDRVIIRVLEKGQVTDTRDDFLYQLGLEGGPDFVEVERLSDSPAREITEALRQLNLLRVDGTISCDDVEIRERHQQPLAERLSSQLLGPRTSFLSYDGRVELSKLFRDSNERVAREFLGREKLFFDEPIPDRAQDR
jgi:hypothetical protein